MKALASLVLAAGLLSATAATASPFPTSSTERPDGHVCAVPRPTSDGYVAVRSGPGIDFPLVNKITRRDLIDVLPGSGSWRRVWFMEDLNDRAVTGWVNVGLLSRVSCGDEQ